jgi:2-polyprenyl-3-methyl-5-hydroxy-6-metoxy-1,4-benzoquinol methylase
MMLNSTLNDALKLAIKMSTEPDLPANDDMASNRLRAKCYDYQIYYRTWHDDSPAHFEQMGRDFATLLGPLVNGREKGAVLDIGCGMGFALNGMKQLGFTDLQGLEQDEGQARSARKMGLNVECVGDTIATLKKRPGRYSVVLLLDVLEHVPVGQQIQFLSAIRQSMLEGARLILQVPNANALFATFWRYNDFTHASSFSPLSLRFCVLNAGFKKLTFVPEDKLNRPSFRLWQKRARASWAHWFLEKIWRLAFEHQLGAEPGNSQRPFGLNILAYVDKQTALE